MDEILAALKSLQVDVASLRDEIRALRSLAPAPSVVSVPSGARAEAAMWAHFGAGHVPALAYSALAESHPVRVALADFARSLRAPPPETTVAMGCLLRRLSRLPGSRLRYHRMTGGGRWRLASPETMVSVPSVLSL